MKFFKAIWGMLCSNIWLKIMALLFALILWSYVLSETNPERERWMNDITVRYENSEELKAKELAISGSLSNILDTIDVRVEVKQSDLKYLSDENVRAYIDLSTINGKGPKTVEVFVETQYGKVLTKNPSEVTLMVDDFVTKTIPVNVDISGSVPDGYYASEPEISPDVVYISGARVDVEKVASAVCSINLTGLTKGYNKSVEVDLLDTDGKPIDSELFAGSIPSVIVNLEVLAKKTVSVDAAGSILGQDDLAPGYEITNIWALPETVEIIGEKSVLSSISKIMLEPYSVSGATEDAAILLDYIPDDGVRVLSTDKAQVNISIRQITETKEYGNLDIQQKNLSRNLDAKLSEDRIDVDVIAGTVELSTLDKSDIVPYVDLEGLTPGVYILDVLFELPEGFTEDNFTPSVKTVTVTITSTR